MYPGCDRPQDVASPRSPRVAVKPSEQEAPAPGRASPTAPGFDGESVRFLEELPDRRTDAVWHERGRGRCDRVLRKPTLRLLEGVRGGYVQPLSPEAAGTRRQISVLRKSGYGKGRFHDHYGFAFYDPEASSKTRAAQLFFKVSGTSRTWEYGFSTGPAGEPYLGRLRQAAAEAPDAVFAHLRAAPRGTLITRHAKDHCRQWQPPEWCDLLRGGAALAFGAGLPVTEFTVARSRPLAELPDADAGLVDEVGEFFAWAWPFFEAGRTGKWPREAGEVKADEAEPATAGGAEVDEYAPRTIEELARRTSLPESLLVDMEDALLSRHQIVLTGPPGTSKTFVAREFARYFAREGTGHPQGLTHTLYMHTSWSYEDFFEGLRPVEREGALSFQNRPGQFLRWVSEELRGQHPRARHVLVLDELNRCDTAAVLGELMQLVEYRGVTVPLLSGRPFVFPPNLYLIGTMNSADRSVGRLDLALRRRFFWIDLHPQPGALQMWLDRPGNNPAGFDAAALSACNALLGLRGIPPDQQVGHALFMGWGGRGAAENSLGEPVTDQPLTERRLRQVVQFSVLPYVRELLAAQFGAGDEELTGKIEAALLACVGGHGEKFE